MKSNIVGTKISVSNSSALCIDTKSNIVNLEFKSDSINNGAGFMVNFFRKGTANSSICGTYLVYNGKPQNLQNTTCMLYLLIFQGDQNDLQYATNHSEILSLFSKDRKF